MEKMTSEVQKVPKTFREIYNSLDNTTPKKEFIGRMMAVTYKSKSAVNGWLYGAFEPDALTQKAISEELGVPSHVLFPKSSFEDETH